jgi:hypothetical protein
MKTEQEISQEIKRIEHELLLNLDRKSHFEALNDADMIVMYERINNDNISQINALKWVLGIEE